MNKAEQVGEAFGKFVGVQAGYFILPWFIEWAGYGVSYWPTVAGLYALNGLLYIAARGVSLGFRSGKDTK